MTVHRHFSLLCLILTLAAGVLIGCQGGPTQPDLTSGPETTPDGVRAQNHQCLGYYALILDTDKQSIEVREVRSAQWHFNMTGVLDQTMGIAAHGVPGESDPSNGLFVLDITLTHPFETKPQFTGFDVKGILMTPGTMNVGSLVFADADESRLLNADGYTRWWNPTEFTQSGMFGYIDGNLASAPPGMLTATVNPYKGFADRLDATTRFGEIVTEPLDSDSGRGVFTAGSSNTRRYQIQFPWTPAPQVKFGYAIDISWNSPDQNPPEEVPDDFSIECNQPEPFYVTLSTTSNTLYFDTEASGGGVGGGSLSLEIVISDWQGQDAGNINEEIEGVRIFAPDLFAGGLDAEYIGQNSTFATYEIDLSGDVVPTHAGETLIVCQVKSSDGSTYQQAPVPAPAANLASYQVLTLDIPNPDCEIDTNNSFAEAVEIDFDELVSDQVCLPDDEADFYSFELPIGAELKGDIKLTCDAEPSLLDLYDSGEQLVAWDEVSDHSASIGLGSLDLGPGVYYIKISTSNSTQVAPYHLEFTAWLNNIAPTDPVEVTPSTLVVKPTRLWVHGDHVFMTGDLGCWVYDLTDPVNPLQVAYEDWVISNRAAFYYPYLYFPERLSSSQSRMNLIDFTESASPVYHEGVLVYDHQITGICMNATDLYVTVRTGPAQTQINIYDYATDPLTPSLSGNTTAPMALEKTTLLEKSGWPTHLAASTIGGLYTYNVDNPSAITTAGSYFLPMGYVKDINCLDDTNGDYLVAVVDADFDGDGWLYTLHQTLTPDLEYLTSIDLPGAAQSVTVQGNYAYIGDGDAGLSICDVTIPGSPVYITSIALISRGYDVSVDGDIACVIPLDAGLQVIDLTIPTSPAYLSRLDTVNTPQSCELAGDYLFVADGPATGGTDEAGTHYAVKTVSIASPENAQVEDEFLLEFPPVQTFLSQDMLAVAEEGHWALFDVSDPLSIGYLSHISTGANNISVGIYDNALYVGTFIMQVHVYDITNPAAPVDGPVLDIPDICNDFSFYDGYMYLSVGYGLEIYSLTDPLNPVYEDTFDLGKLVKESLVIGDLLYVVTKTTVEIIDLTTPNAPVRLGQLEIDPATDLSEIAVEGLYGYTQGAATVPHACTVWPVDDPAYVGQIYDHGPYGDARDLVVSEGFLYEASDYAGLRIYDLY